ncbi:MAG TPA: hypothetical protein VN721_06895 [Flavipsychrobacter sp.]|nr:hypothetical protein [Flavipsychrobacter sp.]
MRKFHLFYKLAIVVSLVIAVQGCTKKSNNNNNVVIETPYGLYFSDTAGALFNTNDGSTVKPLVFFPDGYPSRAITISGNNLIWVKNNAHISTNDGSNFNPTYRFVNPASFGPSTILSSKDEGRVYLTSTQYKGGVVYSDQNGAPGTWIVDSFAKGFSNPAFITSFTELANDSVIGYDALNHRIFYKAGKNRPWVENIISTGSTKLPTNGFFFLTHFNNTIVALDFLGINGAWYSNDLGVTWAQYKGLPIRSLRCGNAPFDQVLLVGTDSLGIYMLNPSTNTFTSANAGLSVNPVVNGIVGKEQIYKTGGTVQYIYIATNKGLYRSQDLGNNWVMVQPGNYVDIY